MRTDCTLHPAQQSCDATEREIKKLFNFNELIMQMMHMLLVKL